ncbi:MAG: bifunctional heptose 7-phosphate kinase/heptose 1-phosphate adenyltransferase [Planctomycetota bacterium]|jgi:rfaE bifunctional protein kinase chain/domain
MLKKRDLMRMLERFGEVTVGVAGDFLADVYVYARPVSVSREAPVMVLKKERQWTSPGGAANAVSNILALSGGVLCVGILGDDEPGRRLSEALLTRGADGAGTVVLPEEQTYTKMRVFAGDLHTIKQQVMRLDCEPADRVDPDVERRVLEAIDKADEKAEAWLVSDYDGDFFTEKVIARFNEIAKAKAVVVDSHRRLASFKGVACATPNENEAALAAGVEISDDSSAADAARRLRKITQAGCVVMTRGNRGMTIAGDDGAVTDIPIVGSAEIVDVAGAGDTVAAVVTLCLAAGIEPVPAALLAAYAASVVCMKTGVATVTIEEVRVAIEEHPLPAL